MVLAKITIKHANARGVRGVAAYRGSVCAMYSVRVSRGVRYVDCSPHTSHHGHLHVL